MFCSSNHSLFIVLRAKGGGGPGDFRGGGISQGSVRREDYGKLTVNITRILQSLGGGGGECDTRKGEYTVLLLPTTAITSASQ